MLIFLLASLLEYTYPICIKQSLEDKIEDKLDHMNIWITYFVNKEIIKEIDIVIAQIQTSAKEYNIDLKMTHNKFQFYSDDLKGFQQQSMIANQGQYFQLKVVLPENETQRKIKYNLHYDNNLFFRTCTSSNFKDGPIIQNYIQDIFRFQESIFDLDNNKLYYQIWIKEIVPSQENQQTIRIIQQIDYFQQRDNIKLTHEFLLKQKRIIYYNSNEGQQFVQNIQQIIRLNYWYLLIFAQKREQNQSYHQEVFIHSIYSEHYQLHTNSTYSFYTGIELILKNSIFTLFTVIQELDQNQINYEELCQPDCQICHKFVCIQCKNNLILQHGNCVCEDHKFASEDGICTYPYQILQFKELQLVNQQNTCLFFGYYYDNAIETCRECLSFRGQQYYECIQNQTVLSIVNPFHQLKSKDQVKKLKLIQQCLYGYFFQRGICLKCPINCSICELNKIGQLICIYCQNSLKVKNLCKYCNLQYCEICINLNSTQVCKICRDKYSLNELNECVYSDEDQFEQLKQLIQQEFQLTRNIQDDKCDLFSQEKQLCVFCSFGFQYVQQQCVQCETQFYQQVFQKSNILGQKQYLNLIDSNFKLNLKQNMFNNQKCYNDTSNHIQNISPILLKSNQIQRIKKKNGLIQVCHTFQYCFNYIDFYVELVQISMEYQLRHDKKYFYTIDKLLQSIQSFNVYLQEYNVKVYNNESQIITVDQFKQCFQMEQIHYVQINLYFFVNLTIINDKIHNDLELVGYTILQLRGINFAQNKSFDFYIICKNLVLIQLRIQSSLNFIIKNSDYVIFNDSTIENIYLNENILFNFQCNLLFDSSRINIINSTFTNSIVIVFMKRLYKGIITDYNLNNINILANSRLFSSYNSTFVISEFRNFNFTNIYMNDSYQFLFITGLVNQRLFIIASNFNYKYIKLNQSRGFYFSNASFLDFTYSNLELIGTSFLFQNYIIETQFSLFFYNFNFIKTLIEPSSLIFRITIIGNIKIQLINIIELQVILNYYEYEIVSIQANKVEIYKYSVKTKESNLIIGKHLNLHAFYIYIIDYQIIGSSVNKIYLKNDMTIMSYDRLLLENIIYDYVVLTDQLISIESANQGLIIIINDSQFKFDIISQNSTKQIEQAKSSIIEFQNKRGQCQFRLTRSKFLIQYIYQNISRLREKLILNLKGGENYNRNNHIIIQDCLFDVTNYDRIMFNYFLISCKTILIIKINVKINELLGFNDITNQSIIFALYANQITIQSVNVNQQAKQSILFDIKDFAVNQNSQIEILNIAVQYGSSIKRFLNMEKIGNCKVFVSNIKIYCNYIDTLFYFILPHQNSYFSLENLYCNLKNYNVDNSIIKLYGSLSFDVYLSNINLCGSHYQSNLGIGFVIDANAGFINIINLMITDFLMPAVQIQADYIKVDKFRVSNCKSENNMIVIFEKEDQLIIMSNVFIWKNKIYNNTLIYFSLRCIQKVIINQWLLYGNQHLKSAFFIEITNQSQLAFNKIRLVNLKLVENACDQCVILKYNKRSILRIAELIVINNYFTNLIKLHGFIARIIDSIFINTVNDHKSIILSSNNKIQIKNSIICSKNSIVFQTPNTFEEIETFNRKFVLKQDYLNDLVVSYKDLDPDVLRITFTNLNQVHNLQQKEIKNKIVFIMNPDVLSNNLMYFPSGQSLNEYRVLIIKQKQYLKLVQNFQLFGYDTNNNRMISANTCQINILSNQQQLLNEIKVIPEILNENQTFMDLVIIGNPYSNEVFTFESVCKFNNKTLIFQQKFQFFKCQLGEYFYLNQCLKCDIGKGYYTVGKRSVQCKQSNFDLIKELNHGLIKIKSGYWRPYYSNDQIEICQQNPQNCFGGWNVGHDSCEKGYIGALCQECDLYNVRGNGHFGKVDSKCYPCRFSLGVMLKILFFIFFQLFSLTITTRSQYLICNRYQSLIASNKFYKILNKLSIDQPSVLIKQIQTYFFYIQFICFSYDIELQLESIMRIISNPIQLANPHYDCQIKNFGTPELITKILIQLATPILILFIFYALFLMINRSLKVKNIFTFIFVPLQFIYITYSICIYQYVIGLITSVNISGIWWIQTKKSLVYYNRDNIPLFSLISFIIFIAIIFIPLNILCILQKRKYQLLDRNWLIKFGYLYQEYQAKMYYWEFIKMGMKVIFITQTILLLSYSDLKYIITVILIVIQSEVIKFFKPYYLQNLNYYDQQFHILMLITSLNLILIRISQDNIYQQIIYVSIMYFVNGIYFLFISKFMINKYFQANPILFDKLQLLMSNQQSQKDSYQSRKSQTYKRFLMMKRYAKSQTQYRINQQQFTQMQSMVKSNLLSNLSETVNEELMCQSQNNIKLSATSSPKYSLKQYKNQEIELQSMQSNMKQITIEDLPSFIQE